MGEPSYLALSVVVFDLIDQVPSKDPPMPLKGRCLSQLGIFTLVYYAQLSNSWSIVI